MEANTLTHLSTGEPTYCPTDTKKVPDLIDFCVIKGIPSHCLNAKSCLDLSSDHSPVLIALSTSTVECTKPPSLTNKDTNWNLFRQMLDNTIDLNIPLKTAIDIDEIVEHLTKSIQESAWYATPATNKTTNLEDLPALLRGKIINKRKIRKLWQTTRAHKQKTQLNQATRELKQLLHEHKNMKIQNYLSNLTPTEATDYSLWNKTNKIHPKT
jgi:hypothetical protein